MKKTITILIVLLIVIVGIYLIASKNNSGAVQVDNSQNSVPDTSSDQTATTPPTTNTENSAVTPADVTVNIKNFSFSPSTLNVLRGTKVIWTNNDTVPHTVTSYSGNLLNSPTLAPRESFSFVFTDVGTVNYHCTVHPTMKAKVIVEEQI